MNTDPLPATPDFPNVVLATGNDTWRVWSRDTDNTDPIHGDGIGDIGQISTPADDNFTVKLAAS